MANEQGQDFQSQAGTKDKGSAADGVKAAVPKEHGQGENEAVQAPKAADSKSPNFQKEAFKGKEGEEKAGTDFQQEANVNP